MSSLTHDRPDVHSNPADEPDADRPGDPDREWEPADLFEPAPDEADLLWWAEHDGDRYAVGPEPDTDTTTDLAWLAAESAGLRGDAGSDPLGARLLAGTALHGLTLSLRFHKHDSASAYLDDPHTRVGRRAVAELERRRGRCASPLAEALDALASWYLHLDTDAARLAAHEVLCYADECERFGSASFDEFVIDEAAHRVGRGRAVCEGRLF